MAILWKALASVSLFTVILAAIIYNGFFDSVLIELGFQHYAEKPSNFNMFFPSFVKMPLNTAVNVGYIFLGAYWCAITTICRENNVINDFDAFIFYLFNIMAGFYGAVQALRIITQIHGFGVMDQWSTLPFFMVVVIWGIYTKWGWNVPLFLFLIIVSLASYSLTLFTPIGFEIALGIHVVLAVTGALIGYSKYPCRNARHYFVLALLSCAGFIGLKLLDFELVKYHEIFNKVSGHFLSKIADIMQIHYVNEYFRSLVIQRFLLQKAKKGKSD
ncbi:transmembrane protein 187-like isoform X2 [Haliotis rufescens]|uniref:transmembrane protein 187-like isoform X2 n=1 Tax=Haliotis rufescens TaxID=6454 RepID=UPI00201F7014|nr:transmembrane protein 187-like isoform X2 [Haliotis rufescens]